MTNNADFVLIDSTVEGPVNNTTGSAITVLGTVDFNGLVSGPGNFFGPGTSNFNGGISIGASPAEVSFEGEVVLGNSNTLFIEIGGTLAGTEFDMLDIAGIADLGGTLDVSLLGGFSPSVGDTFEILTAASVLDTFAVENLPNIGGLSWEVSYNPTSVVLSVLSPFTADFDLDGDVDADDLTKWQNDFGGPGSDADGDGDSDGADYLAWQQQFGSPGAPGSLASSQAVPEPTSALPVLAGTLYFACKRRTVGVS